MLAQLEHVGDQAGETGRSRTASPGDRQEAEPQQGFGGLAVGWGRWFFFHMLVSLGCCARLCSSCSRVSRRRKRSAP